jgi:selenocysteine-specific elongation factor
MIPPASRHLVVATAGHIDHGKTALVRALTGMETDRLEEERRRGITIELGFAFLGDDVTIIDVPGHERFIKTMVAGVSTVDLALLVVAADDGVMPQTREHLAILNLLGVPHLFVVLSKIHTVMPEWVDLVAEEIRALLPDRFRTAPFFRCDSISGEGVDRLKDAILEFQRTLPPRRDSGVFRLPVDRAFSVKGHGTVVTGTILGGSIHVGDHLKVMPLGFAVRVRGLQSHGQERSVLSVGERAAVNLTGVRIGEIVRGDWICQPDAFQATRSLDVALEILPDAPPLRRRERVRVNVGTLEALGRVFLLDRTILNPGERGWAQIALEQSVMAARLDRFVIRRYSPLQTLGGGVVLDPLPPRRIGADPQETAALRTLETEDAECALFTRINTAGLEGYSIAQALAFSNAPQSVVREWIRRLQASRRVVLIADEGEDSLYSMQALTEAKQAVLERLRLFHAQHPDLPGLHRAELVGELIRRMPAPLVERAVAELIGVELEEQRGILKKSDHRIRLSPDQEARIEGILTRLEEAGFNPVSRGALQRTVGGGESEILFALNLLERQKLILPIGGGFLTSAAVQRAWDIVQGELSSGGKTTAQLRDALGCARKSAVALLEYFDSIGNTERSGEVRTLLPQNDDER